MARAPRRKAGRPKGTRNKTTKLTPRTQRGLKLMVSQLEAELAAAHRQYAALKAIALQG